MPDETEIVEAILKRARRLPAGYSQVGDDVAVVPASGGRLVMKVDMLVESTDVPRGMGFRRAARKSVAMCVSDFAAKGVRPDSYMVSLGISRGTTARQIRELALGFRDASTEWRVKMVGGDTNEASELVIDCVMVGFARRVVGRGGAGPGDLVVTTGEFGYPPAGLAILEGANGGGAFRNAALRSVLMPTPDLKLGLALAPYWTSVMDSSDGLARSLHTLARASGMRIRIDRMPAVPDLGQFARANKLLAEELVLQGGEEYLLVGTIRAGRFREASRAARNCGGRLIEVGLVEGRGTGVVLKDEGGLRPIEDAGWTHLL